MSRSFSNLRYFSLRLGADQVDLALALAGPDLANHLEAGVQDGVRLVDDGVVAALWVDGAPAQHRGGLLEVAVPVPVDVGHHDGEAERLAEALLVDAHLAELVHGAEATGQDDDPAVALLALGHAVGSQSPEEGSALQEVLDLVERVDELGGGLDGVEHLRPDADAHLLVADSTVDPSAVELTDEATTAAADQDAVGCHLGELLARLVGVRTHHLAHAVGLGGLARAALDDDDVHAGVVRADALHEGLDIGHHPAARHAHVAGDLVERAQVAVGVELGDRVDHTRNRTQGAGSAEAGVGEGLEAVDDLASHLRPSIGVPILGRSVAGGWPLVFVTLFVLWRDCQQNRFSSDFYFHYLKW